jgi:hypothetical protein
VAVPTTATYDAATQAVTLQPATPLTLSSHYAVVAGDEIRDVAGQPLAVKKWSLSTALDADPRSSELSVVLEKGQHQLLRFHADGSEAERRTLDVLDRRWVLADRRARLDGREGSWLRLTDASLGGWWVVESGRAHALGQVEEALIADGTHITLPPVEHAVHTFGANGPSLDDDRAIAGGRTVTVNRRRVVDGRTFLRLADTEFAGGWIEANPAVTPTEVVARRILAIEPRPVEVSLIPASGPQMAFRFDANGRVVQRRLLTDADILEEVLTTAETRVVAGTRFAVIASGGLAGWALAEGPDLLVMPATRVPEAAG